MERWASVNEENKHLATLRVYNNAKPNGQARIFMFLPPNIDPSSSSLPPSGAPPHNPTRPYFAEFTKFQTIGPEPDVYELDMVNDHVENQIVVAERPKDNSFNISDDPQPKNQPVNSRARTTILTGRILHECSMRPGFSTNYRKQMRKRHELYNTKTRTVKRIEQAGISGGRGGINMLTSGVGVHSGGTFGDLVVRSPAISRSHYVTKPYIFSPENEAETTEGTVRAHGKNASEPTSRSTLPALPRYANVDSSQSAREDTTARGIPQGGIVRSRNASPVWRTQWTLGAQGEFQGGRRKLLLCSSSAYITLTLCCRSRTKMVQVPVCLLAN